MLRFIDSFSHYTTITDKYNLNVNSSVTAINAGTGRLSGDSLRISSNSLGSGNQGGVRKTLTSQQTWIVGVAFKTSLASPTDYPIIALDDAGSNQVDVVLTSTSKLRFRRNGTTIATGATTILANVWYYIELKCKIDNTTGTYDVRINGVTEISGSGTDTQNTGNATADQVRLGFLSGVGNQLGGNSVDHSDFYVCDDTTGTNNDFLGDVRVEYRAPNGNGNSSQLVGSDGNSTDNYLLVDEHPPNSDTDYVESSTVGDKDTYAFQDLTPTSATVYGVQIGLWAKKTDAGTRAIRSVARLSATETESADETLSASYQYFFDIRETKPGGGSWSVSDVNSAEFGVKVAA